jgi:4a-hydroxytetrahydrobiopterin dehydratase
MAANTAETLRAKGCKPCEGGVEPLSRDEAHRLVEELDNWKLEESRIRRRWEVKDFQAGVDFINRVAELAEEEGHHPDAHLTGYRNVTIELSTHAVGGLTENDFILAAKIDALPVEIRRS